MDLFDAKSTALITQLQRQQGAYLLVGGYAVNSLRVIDEPFILDVMTHINGVTFETAYAQHKLYDLDGLEIHLIHRNDRVINKRSSAREKNLADVHSLQFIEAYWNGQKLEVYEKPTPQVPAPSATDEPGGSAAE